MFKEVKTKFVCYSRNITISKDKTLIKALKFFKKIKSLICSKITNVKEYLWKKITINYNLITSRSQDLKGVIALNFAVNIVSTKFMRQRAESLVTIYQ